MQETVPLILAPVFQPLWVMILVMLIERLWFWPEAYHPLSFFRLLANSMARKVNKANDNSQVQQLISGSLAILVLLVPIILILLVLTNLAEFPIFFDGLLLLISLRFSPILAGNKKLAQALKEDKKALARNILNPFVLRETDKLSPLGIAKATIESTLLRFSYQYCGVLFWFLLLGGTGAFAYRLIFEFAQVWNTKLARFRYFGKPAARLLVLLSWLPVRVAALCMAVSENFSGTFKALRQSGRQHSQHAALLAMHGGALSIELGGPAYYDGQKIRLPKVGGQRAVRFDDLSRTRFAIFKAKLVFLVFVIMISALLFAARQG